MTDEIWTTTVRLPDELYLWVVSMARQDHRSINGEILTLLSEARTARDDQA
jgi:hypothetical protein